MKEFIIFLGWMVDTRRLITILPIEKWKAWLGSIEDTMTKQKVTYQELTTLI